VLLRRLRALLSYLIGVDELAGELELGRLDPIDPSTIPKTRPKGLDAEKIIKKERSRSIENLSDNEQTLIF